MKIQDSADSPNSLKTTWHSEQDDDEFGKPEQEIKTEKKISKCTCTKVMHLLVLISSVLGGSMIGPVANFVPAEGIFLKNAWRFMSL